MTTFNFIMVFKFIRLLPAIGKSVASSPLGNIAASNCQPVTSLGHSHSLLMRDSKLSHNLDRHAMGVDRTINQPFLRRPDHDLLTRSSVKMQPSSHGVEGGKVSLMGAEYENSLFSSSLSDLFTRNCTFLSLSNACVLHANCLCLSLSCDFFVESFWIYCIPFLIQ